MSYRIEVSRGGQVQRKIPAGTWRDAAAERYLEIIREYRSEYTITLRDITTNATLAERMGSKS